MGTCRVECWSLDSEWPQEVQLEMFCQITDNSNSFPSEMDTVWPPIHPHPFCNRRMAIPHHTKNFFSSRRSVHRWTADFAESFPSTSRFPGRIPASRCSGGDALVFILEIKTGPKLGLVST